MRTILTPHKTLEEAESIKIKLDYVPKIVTVSIVTNQLKTFVII